MSTQLHVVGGGIAGLAAAWELSAVDGVEVTVHETSGPLGRQGPHLALRRPRRRRGSRRLPAPGPLGPGPRPRAGAGGRGRPPGGAHARTSGAVARCDRCRPEHVLGVPLDLDDLAATGLLDDAELAETRAGLRRPGTAGDGEGPLGRRPGRQGGGSAGPGPDRGPAARRHQRRPGGRHERRRPHPPAAGRRPPPRGPPRRPAGPAGRGRPGRPGLRRLRGRHPAPGRPTGRAPSHDRGVDAAPRRASSTPWATSRPTVWSSPCPPSSAADLLADAARAPSGLLNTIGYASRRAGDPRRPPRGPSTDRSTPPGSSCPTPRACCSPRAPGARRKWAHLGDGDTVVLRASAGSAGDDRIDHLDDDELVDAPPRRPGARPWASTGRPDRGPGQPLGALAAPVPGRPPRPGRRHRGDVGRRARRGLALAGAAYGGVGLPACIHDGREAARRLLDARG